jgi:hypothetical protein
MLYTVLTEEGSTEIKVLKEYREGRKRVKDEYMN